MRNLLLPGISQSYHTGIKEEDTCGEYDVVEPQLAVEVQIGVSACTDK